jgi:hypothetical protein
MSYLLQYARRPDSASTRSRGARVDERTRLNRAGLYGDAYVRVLVGRRRRGRHPRLELQIADCVNTINLEFSLETAELRENSLFKVDTLLDALRHFRAGLAAEVALREPKTHDTR